MTKTSQSETNRLDMARSAIVNYKKMPFARRANTDLTTWVSLKAECTIEVARALIEQIEREKNGSSAEAPVVELPSEPLKRSEPESAPEPAASEEISRKRKVLSEKKRGGADARKLGGTNGQRLTAKKPAAKTARSTRSTTQTRASSDKIYFSTKDVAQLLGINFGRLINFINGAVPPPAGTKLPKAPQNKLGRQYAWTRNEVKAWAEWRTAQLQRASQRMIARLQLLDLVSKDKIEAAVEQASSSDSDE